MRPSGCAQATLERIRIVATVGDEALQASRNGRDGRGGDRHIAGIIGYEMGNYRASENVCNEINFRGLPGARIADGLRPRPSLPPCAKRRALMYVESSDALSVTDPARRGGQHVAP